MMYHPYHHSKVIKKYYVPTMLTTGEATEGKVLKI